MKPNKDETISSVVMDIIARLESACGASAMPPKMIRAMADERGWIKDVSTLRLTTRELCKRLGVKDYVLYSWRKEGKGPAFMKIGEGPKAIILYRMADVLAWEDAQVQQPTQEVEHEE